MEILNKYTCKVISLIKSFQWVINSCILKYSCIYGRDTGNFCGLCAWVPFINQSMSPVFSQPHNRHYICIIISTYRLYWSILTVNYGGEKDLLIPREELVLVYIKVCQNTMSIIYSKWELWRWVSQHKIIYPIE